MLSEKFTKKHSSKRTILTFEKNKSMKRRTCHFHMFIFFFVIDTVIKMKRYAAIYNSEDILKIMKET